MRSTFLTSAVKWLAVLLLASLAACSEAENKLPGEADFDPDRLAPATKPPEGPYPRGDADPAFALDPATVGPEVTVLSPSRGAQITAGSVQVRVRAEDVNGVSGVTIAGITASSSGGNVYTATVNLQPSRVNYIEVLATDGLGNVADAHFTVVQGQFRPIDQHMPAVMGVSLSNSGLDKAEAITESLTANLNLYTLVATHNPLLESFAADISATSLAHDPLRLNIAGAQDGAQITVHLDNVTLGVLVDTPLFNTNANLIADRATAVVDARVSPDPSGPRDTIKSALGLEIDSIDTSFVNFDVTHDVGLVNTIVSLLRGVVRDIVEKKLEGILGDVLDEKLRVALPGFGQPIPVEIPVPLVGTSSIDMAFAADAANGSAQTGLGLAAGIKVTPTNPVLTGVTQNVFVAGTTAVPAVLTGDDFAIGMSSDGANAFMHALWLAGGIRLRVDGTNPTGDSPFQLSTKLLMPFFPQLRGLAPDPNTPITLEVTTEMPPVASIGKNGNTIELHVTEFQVKVFIDYMDGQPALEVMTLRAALDLRAGVAVQNSALVVPSLEAPNVAADLTREPVVDLADSEVEVFLRAVLPYLLDKFKDKIPAMPIPALPFGLELNNPRIEVQPDFIIVRGQL